MLVAQKVKNLSVMWETWVQSLGWEDATHSCILAWRILMDRGTWVGYSSWGGKESGTRVTKHSGAQYMYMYTHTHTHTYTCTHIHTHTHTHTHTPLSFFKLFSHLGYYIILSKVLCAI